MSVLAVFTPRTAAADVAPEPAVPLIDWEPLADGRWLGRIGFDRAGEVRPTATGFHLADWDGEDLGTWPTLAEAKRRLEPGVRAALRDAADRGDRPVASLLGTAALSTTAVALLTTAAWFALQAL